MRARHRPGVAAGRLAALLAGTLFIATPGASEPESPTPPESRTRNTMHGIFDAITTLLPLSWSEAKFRDPASRATIEPALDALAAGGAQLAAHGQGSDAGFAFLSRSLARDSAEVRRRYRAGRFEEARYLLHEMTEDCVACHSRLPSDRRFPRGEDFVTTSEVAALPLDERAQLEMATRQFDRALVTLEALLQDPTVSPGSVDLGGYIDDYLEICIRVKSDPGRAAAALRKLLARPDVSAALRVNLEAWVADLDALGPEPAGSRVERARAHIAQAEARARYANDRIGLVHYVAASGLLHQEAATAESAGPELAEVYYLLGLVESRVGRSFWLSQTEYLLQTAIELDPSGPNAEDAYALLEEFTISGYTGAEGVQIPDDVAKRLEALRAKINRR